MKISEITNAQDKLDLLKSIMDNTWRTISQQGTNPIPTTPISQSIKTKPIYKSTALNKPKALPKKTKPKIPKRAPMAPAPKPFPKAKPLAPTPQHIKNQQQQSQQEYAQAVKKTFDKDVARMPKSLQPLPTSIVSPIGGGDPELEKKLDFARRQGEQNRASGSEPHLINKNPTY